MRSVLIGIQARSGSTRLPKKAFELIGGKMMLDHVIEACRKAGSYVLKRQPLLKEVSVCVLTPEGDPVAKAFQSRCDILEGPSHDVLGRYLLATDRYQPDLVVRITGDCPMIPSYTISRLISLACQQGYDYIANVDGRFRTAIDGTDCEVISARLLRQAGQLASDPSDREHVTTWIRRERPEWAHVGAVINYFDLSDLKLSVDTREDLEAVRLAYSSAADKYRQAVHVFGQHSVHIL